MIKSSIPNLLTSLNLACGFLAILSDDLKLGVSLVILGGIFDVFDGLVARALKVSSSIGKELDSLADVVSFGVAPSVLFYKAYAFEGNYLFLIGSVIIVVAGALRLARFNISESQSNYFEGLAIPASGLMLCGLVYAQDLLPLNIYSYLIITSLLAFLNLSKIKMFSFKQFGQMIVKVYFASIALSGVLIGIWRPELILAGVIGLYILLACIEHMRLSWK